MTAIFKERYFLIATFLMLGLVSCQPPQNPTEEAAVVAKPYFDLVGFLDKQEKHLIAHEAGLRKEMNINGKSEKVLEDSVDWAKELMLFTEADINKSVLFNTYQIDSTANKITYKALKKKHKIQWISVKKSGNFISEVNIKFEEKNLIYHSEREMTLSLQQEELSGFKIQGYQKMWADDTLKYELHAEVVK